MFSKLIFFEPCKFPSSTNITAFGKAFSLKYRFHMGAGMCD